MAPFRNRDRSNRSGRGQVEHNVLEGLPINQYREVEITIGPNSTESKQLVKDEWPDPPMPRDSHLLPEHSQQILLRAKTARIWKAPPPPEDDKEIMDEEEEHKEVRQGFTIKKWVRVPRHLEEPEVEYLAKRRKGLPSRHVSNSHPVVPLAPMRETKVKKTDAEGNVNVYKVLVPEGQALEGEIQPTDAVIDATPTPAAPGTVVEGVGVVNAEGVVVANDVHVLQQQTPPRRRPPPPKKKKRSGPGRGKKKVLFADGATEQETPKSSTGSELLTVPGIKQEGSVEPSEGGDTPMPDAADEDEISGEEGSDDEDHDEGTRSPIPAQVIPPPTAPAKTVSDSDAEHTRDSVAGETISAETAPLAASAPVPSSELVASEVDTATAEPHLKPKLEEAPHHDQSTSPEQPFSTITHSRQNSIAHVPSSVPEPAPAQGLTPVEVVQPTLPTTNTETPSTDETHVFDEPDLLGSLERQLERDSETMRS